MRPLHAYLWAWLCAVALLLGTTSLLGLALGEGARVPMGPVGALAALALSAWAWRRARRSMGARIEGWNGATRT